MLGQGLGYSILDPGCLKDLSSVLDPVPFHHDSFLYGLPDYLGPVQLGKTSHAGFEVVRYSDVHDGHRYRLYMSLRAHKKPRDALELPRQQTTGPTPLKRDIGYCETKAEFYSTQQ